MNYNEFLPWHTWKCLPENKNLNHDDALRKYNVERDQHLKKLIYYENQQKMKNNGGD